MVHLVLNKKKLFHPFKRTFLLFESIHMKHKICLETKPKGYNNFVGGD